MARDGKNRFYRTLNLPKEDRKLLRWYRGIVKKMQQEPENKKEENNE